jgi:hypothetical protein
MKAKADHREEQAYVVNGAKLTAYGNNNKLYVSSISWQFF